MRIAIGLALLLGVAACGGDEPPPSVRELEKKSGFDRKAIEEMMRASGGLEGASKVISRPLTPKDVETFIAVFPEYSTSVRTPGGMKAVFDKHGLVATEWILIQSRILAAASSTRFPNAAASDLMKADAEIVRPYLDRIAAATGQKPK